MQRIMSAGFFPKELPPPFTTGSFAAYMATAPGGFDLKKQNNYISRPCTHNLARSGTLRRKLSIPNPVNFYQLVNSLVVNWASLNLLLAKSKISLTTPTYTTTGLRAITPKHGFDQLPLSRASVRAGRRYILRTDINTFYPSLYTHSIPWAIHGKDVAKASPHNMQLIGNELDLIARNGQSAQTMGVPIGPDTSLMLAEIVLSAIDTKIEAEIGVRGFRYMDDVEFCFDSYAKAENALAVIQELLAEFELQLNPRKSHISELPVPLEAFWTPHLRLFNFRGKARSQQYDLLGYFGRAFELAESNKEEAILRYALARTANEQIQKDNWELYQDILLQCITVEPGTAPRVVTELFKYIDQVDLDFQKIGDTLQEVMRLHAPLGHGSEVAWAIWGMLLLKIPIDDETVRILQKMKDNVVALLVLDSRKKGLISKNIVFDEWINLMNGSELRTENWLLAYEASVKEWLPHDGEGDYIGKDAHFGSLRKGSVSFYNAEIHSGAQKVKALDADISKILVTENIFGVSP